MQVKLTQDYYGFFRQPVQPDRQARPEQTPSRPQPQAPRTVLPAERLVEGELLRNRSNGSNKTLDDLLQRSRFADQGAGSQDISAQTAQRAIDTYRGYASLSQTAQGASGYRGVDFYA